MKLFITYRNKIISFNIEFKAISFSFYFFQIVYKFHTKPTSIRGGESDQRLYLYVISQEVKKHV